jgi:NitT/TauT family transport system substrate-binding protein
MSKQINIIAIAFLVIISILIITGLVNNGKSETRLQANNTTNSATSNTSNSNPNSTNLETTKIKIGHIPVAQSLPLYTAIEKGYFQEAGIEPELVKFDAPNLYSDALITNNIDFTAPNVATGILSIIESKNPNKFQIINTSYASEENPSDVLVVPTDSTASSIVDLKSKTCAILAGPQFKTIFTKVASDAGLKATEQGQNGDIFYKELPVTDHVTALASKGVDCILGLEPAGTVAITKGIGKLLGVSPISKSLGGRFYGATGAVNKTFSTKNPNTTKKVVEIMDRAIVDIQTNPNENRKYLVKYLNIPEPLANNLKLQAFRSSRQINSEDIGFVNKFLDIFVEQKIYTTRPNLQATLYQPIN